MSTIFTLIEIVEWNALNLDAKMPKAFSTTLLAQENL